MEEINKSRNEFLRSWDEVLRKNFVKRNDGTYAVREKIEHPGSIGTGINMLDYFNTAPNEEDQENGAAIRTLERMKNMQNNNTGCEYLEELQHALREAGPNIVSMREIKPAEPINAIIFVINGTGASGKDKLVKYVQDYMLDDRYSFNISSIDPVREAAHVLISASIGNDCADETEKEKPDWYRTMLSSMKLVWDNVWTNSVSSLQYIIKKIRTCFPSDEQRCAIFVHIREPENIQALINAYEEGKVLPLETSQLCTMLVTGRVDPHQYSNHSDQNVDNFNYDIVIDNSKGLEDLSKAARIIANAIEETFTKSN